MIGLPAMKLDYGSALLLIALVFMLDICDTPVATEALATLKLVSLTGTIITLKGKDQTGCLRPQGPLCDSVLHITNGEV